MPLYQEREAGSGWLDPGSSASPLLLNCRGMIYEREPSLVNWLGAMAITLCILSWWNEQSVPATLLWIAECLKGIFASQAVAT